MEAQIKTLHLDITRSAEIPVGKKTLPVGHEAGAALTTGQLNTVVGYLALNTSTTGCAKMLPLFHPERYCVWSAKHCSWLQRAYASNDCASLTLPLERKRLLALLVGTTLLLDMRRLRMLLPGTALLS